MKKNSSAELVVSCARRCGGRFLKKDPSNSRWCIVPQKVARRKASQALREHNTAKERAKKKAKHVKRKQVDDVN